MSLKFDQASLASACFETFIEEFQSDVELRHTKALAKKNKKRILSLLLTITL